MKSSFAEQNLSFELGRRSAESGEPNAMAWARSALTASAALLVGSGLAFWPRADVEVFGRGAARLAGVLLGCPVVRIESGWWLSANPPSVVSAACSGTTFFMMLSALVGWRLARIFRPSGDEGAGPSTRWARRGVAIESSRKSKSPRRFEELRPCSGVSSYLKEIAGAATTVCLWRVVVGVLGALVLAITANGLRVAAVVQAHRWVIPHFPDQYRGALHLATGLAVFLPALVGVNLLLEKYGRTRSTLHTRR
ncbi:MAG: archaeosortase/exosortase family protein [Nibricoccus sp.]